MSDYQPDSRYTLQSGESKKQKPAEKPDNFYGRSSQPASCEFQKSPHSVIFTKNMNHEFGFYFKSSDSFAALGTAGKKSSANYEKYPAGFGTVGTKLDIHPTAISCSVRDAGQITFVYKGGLDGSGRP